METKTAELIVPIRSYENHGAHKITIPKTVINDLGLQKGDMVRITITPVMRPSIKEAE